MHVNSASYLFKSILKKKACLPTKIFATDVNRRKHGLEVAKRKGALGSSWVTYWEVSAQVYSHNRRLRGEVKGSLLHGTTRCSPSPSTYSSHHSWATPEVLVTFTSLSFLRNVTLNHFCHRAEGQEHTARPGHGPGMLLVTELILTAANTAK